MAIEQGIVTRSIAGSSRAWVKTIQNSACASCSSRHSCAEGGRNHEREVEVINEIGARPGDRIQIMISTRSLLKISFLLYIFPILLMLAAGLTGNAMAPRLSLDPSVTAAVAAGAGLLAGMAVIFAGGRRLGSRKEYHPRIIRVIGRHSATPCTGQGPVGR